VKREGLLFTQINKKLLNLLYKEQNCVPFERRILSRLPLHIEPSAVDIQFQKRGYSAKWWANHS